MNKISKVIHRNYQLTSFLVRIISWPLHVHTKNPKHHLTQQRPAFALRPLVRLVEITAKSTYT
jgi:hypothetical protein